MKKALLVVVALVLVFTLAACGGNNGGNNEPSGPVTIIITNGKGEIAQQWKDAAAAFTKQYPDIIVDAQSQNVGDELGPLEKLTAAGKTVTIAMLEPGAVNGKYAGFGIDLSNEDWVKDTDLAFKDTTGKVVGFPFAVEGYGLVYNQKVLDKAVGGTFDPATITNRVKLVELLDKIVASGVAKPVAFQAEAWSVGNHYSAQHFNQPNGGYALQAKLKSGEATFENDQYFKGYLETQKILASEKYNLYGGKKLLNPNYDAAHLAVGKGEAAMLFNGNWAAGSLQNETDKFGFIPVPWSDTDDELNTKYNIGPTQVLAINKEASEAEQAAAKKFLNWLVYDEAGQDFTTVKSDIISAFKNNNKSVKSSLGQFWQQAIKDGKAVDFSTNYVSAADYYEKIGPVVQKVLAGKAEDKELFDTLNKYWQSLK